MSRGNKLGEYKCDGCEEKIKKGDKCASVSSLTRLHLCGKCRKIIPDVLYNFILNAIDEEMNSHYTIYHMED